jgi:hypothetical protein
LRLHSEHGEGSLEHAAEWSRPRRAPSPAATRRSLPRAVRRHSPGRVKAAGPGHRFQLRRRLLRVVPAVHGPREYTGKAQRPNPAQCRSEYWQMGEMAYPKPTGLTARFGRPGRAVSRPSSPASQRVGEVDARCMGVPSPIERRIPSGRETSWLRAHVAIKSG